MIVHRFLLMAVAAVLCLGAYRGLRGPTYADLDEYLATHALSLRGEVLDVAGRTVFRAVEESALEVAADGDAAVPADVYVADLVYGANGRLVEASEPRNLTSSRYGDEGDLISDGERVAFATRIYGRVETLTVLDMRGDDPALVDGWSDRDVWMDSITMWQEVGSRAGVDIRRFAFPEPVLELSLAWNADGALAIDADGTAIVLDPADEAGAGVLTYFPREKSKRPTIHWFVDTVRNGGYLPDGTIDWAKTRFYYVAEGVRWARYMFGGDDTEAEIEALAAEALARKADASEFSGAKMENWPPEEIASAHKGVPWHPPPYDWFLKNPGAPEPFYVTTVRPFKERPIALYDVVAWDPGQVELNMVAGTREPMSRTGYIGTGKVPRGPGILRFVAAFNGGFQGDHGDYGMMVDRNHLLPSKDLSATIARWRDGSASLGSWPVGLSVPPHLMSFRQNLSPLVADGKINPHGRTWWGSTVTAADAEDPSRTTRSGLCLTNTGKLAYFFARTSNWREMADTMLLADCEYGVHLDMNSGHTGGEFYRVWDEKAEKYDVDRMTPNVSHMLYPRWIKTDARDFFYLTLRKVLPGKSEGLEWTATGLPQAGMPPSFIAAEGPGDTVVVKVDPERAHLSMRPGEAEPESTTGAVVPVSSDEDNSAALHISLGVSDSAAPLGLMTRRSLLFPPRAGLPTLGVACSDRHGFAGTRSVCAAELATWGDGLNLGPSLTDFKQGKAIVPGEPVYLALAHDEDGFLVIAASESGDGDAVLKALAAAGVTTAGDGLASVVSLDLGGRKPAIWAETTEGARRFILGEGKETVGASELRMEPREKPNAGRVWPDVDADKDKKPGDKS